MHQERTMIAVKSLYKTFHLPLEKSNGLKQVLLNIFRHSSKKKKGYISQRVLSDISFEVKEGDFVGIVGRNGSGKSTLLKLMAGIYEPDRGVIEVGGSLTPFIELGVGFNPELTGRENIYMNGALLGFSRAEVDDMYRDIVTFAELEKFMDQKLKNYSSGMQVRLAFSIAIRAESDILLLDEVLAVGDSAFQQKCFDYFERLKKKNKTVVLVTHDMSAVRRFCSKAIFIHNGRLVKAGRPSEIADLYLEENIEKKKDESNGLKLSVNHSLKAKISDTTKEDVTIDFHFTSNDKEPMYLGISIIKDGISIAEITTSLKKPLLDSGSVQYTLDTTVFNEGVYQVTAALFLLKNRELVAVAKQRNIFKITHHDLTKGSALKLADTWKYKVDV